MVVTLSVKVLPNVPAGTYINKAIVTNSDDPTPGCTVSLQGIDCGPNPPNNYDQEPTPVTRSVNLTLDKTDNGATPSRAVAHSTTR